jgi:hypothetical protein
MTDRVFVFIGMSPDMLSSKGGIVTLFSVVVVLDLTLALLSWDIPRSPQSQLRQGKRPGGRECRRHRDPDNRRIRAGQPGWGTHR